MFWNNMATNLCHETPLSTSMLYEPCLSPTVFFIHFLWPFVIIIIIIIIILLVSSVGLLNRGSWGPNLLLGAGSHCLELQLELQLQLTPTNSTLRGTGLYDCLTIPVSVAFVPNSTHPRSRLYLDIFNRMHLFLDWWIGRRSICYTSTCFCEIFRPILTVDFSLEC